MILKKHFKIAYAVTLQYREGVLRCWKWLWLCVLYVEPNVGESQLEAFGMQGPGAVLVPALCSGIGLYWRRGAAETPHPPEGGSRLAAESTKLLQDLTVLKEHLLADTYRRSPLLGLLCLFCSSGLTASAGALQSWRAAGVGTGHLRKAVEGLFIHLIIAGRQVFWCEGFEGTLNASLFVLVCSRTTA